MGELSATPTERVAGGIDHPNSSKGGVKEAGACIMTWVPVRKIFGPVGPEKMVICDRFA